MRHKSRTSWFNPEVNENLISELQIGKFLLRSVSFDQKSSNVAHTTNYGLRGQFLPQTSYELTTKKFHFNHIEMRFNHG